LGLLKILKFLKPILRLSLAIKLTAFFVSQTLERFGSSSKASSGKKKRILVLNSIRYMNDLEVLSKSQDLELLFLNIDTHVRINSLSMSKHHDRWEFFKESDEVIVKDKERLFKYLKVFIPALARYANIDGILTCSFYYVQDQIWDKAAKSSDVPFFAIYKENLKYEVRGDYSIELYNERNYKFYGNKLLVFDEKSKSILARAKVAKTEDILVTGMLRIDNIFREVNSELPILTKKMVTLFSFRHAIGGFLTVDDSFEVCFSKDGKKGVVNLFDEVHCSIAELALENPDVVFVIKTKWDGIWPEKIKDAWSRKLSFDPTTLKNLTMTSEVDAQELIKSSSVVIGLNSTTLLESRLYGKETIIPFYSEAKDKYEHEVLFRDFFNDFTIVGSSKELKEEILSKLEKPSGDKSSLSAEAISRYFGFFDGENLTRVVAAFDDEIRRCRSV